MQCMDYPLISLQQQRQNLTVFGVELFLKVIGDQTAFFIEKVTVGAFKQNPGIFFPPGGFFALKTLKITKNRFLFSAVLGAFTVR